jgi:hypothetical protein
MRREIFLAKVRREEGGQGILKRPIWHPWNSSKVPELGVFTTLPYLLCVALIEGFRLLQESGQITYLSISGRALNKRLRGILGLWR